VPHRADEQQFIAGLRCFAGGIGRFAVRSACHSSAGLPTSFCGPQFANRDLFHCAKLVEQGSGLFEIRGVEPFGKPGEDVIQQLAGVTLLALALPQSARPPLRSSMISPASTGDLECVVEAGFRFRRIVG
jgi:hypothetical protein